jgi:hypothetical protein
MSETRNGKPRTLQDASGPILFGAGTVLGEFTMLLSIPPKFTVAAHTDMVLWGLKRAVYTTVQVHLTEGQPCPSTTLVRCRGGVEVV